MASLTPKKIIQRHYITPKAVTTEHVVAILGVDLSRDPARVLLEEKRIRLLKKSAHMFFSVKIKQIMRDTAVEKKMMDLDTGKVVTKFSDIGKEFAVALTKKSAEDLFYVCFGKFDLSPKWEFRLEAEFLAEEGLAYGKKEHTDVARKGPPPGTGILSIIYDKKTELVKVIMQKARRYHGFYIRIRHRQNSDGGEEKSGRRVKGVFYKHFLVRDKCFTDDINQQLLTTASPVDDQTATSSFDAGVNDDDDDSSLLSDMSDIIENYVAPLRERATAAITNAENFVADFDNTADNVVCLTNRELAMAPDSGSVILLDQNYTAGGFVEMKSTSRTVSTCNSSSSGMTSQNLPVLRPPRTFASRADVDFSDPCFQNIRDSIEEINRRTPARLATSETRHVFLKPAPSETRFDEIFAEASKTVSSGRKKTLSKNPKRLRQEERSEIIVLKKKKEQETVMLKRKDDDELQKTIEEVSKLVKKSNSNKRTVQSSLKSFISCTKKRRNHSAKRKSANKNKSKEAGKKSEEIEKHASSTKTAIVTIDQASSGLDTEADDCVLEVHDVFEYGTGSSKDLYIRVLWKEDGLQDEPFLLILEDAPGAISQFLAQNYHLKELVAIYFPEVDAAEEKANNEDENVDESTTKEKKKNQTTEKEDEVEQETYLCNHNHLLLENLKTETRKAYFRNNNKYCGVACEKCNTVITTANTLKPVYCCINEHHGCTKSVCCKCIVDIIRVGNEAAGSRRPKRHG